MIGHLQSAPGDPRAAACRGGGSLFEYTLAAQVARKKAKGAVCVDCFRDFVLLLYLSIGWLIGWIGLIMID